MSLSYKIRRLRVKLRAPKKKELDLDEIQKRAYDIVVQMINDKDSKLMYEIDYGRRGIENGNVWVVIKPNKISITNSVSHDDVYIDDRIHEDLISKFNAKMSRKFNAKDGHYRDKTKNRLETIKSQMNN